MEHPQVKGSKVKELKTLRRLGQDPLPVFVISFSLVQFSSPWINQPTYIVVDFFFFTFSYSVHTLAQSKHILSKCSLF